MIDLSTDDGMRSAFRAIADWDVADHGEGQGSGDDVVVLAPRVATRHGGSLRWAAAAAAVLLAAAGIALGSRQSADRTAAASGEWSTMAPSPLEPRVEPVTLWTGEELLVWGGHDTAGDEYTDGAMYDPATDTWRRITDSPYGQSRGEGPRVGANTALYSTNVTPRAWAGDRAVFVLGNPVEPWAWDLVSYEPGPDEWTTIDSARFDQRSDDQLVLREGTATVDSPTALVWTGGELLVFGWRFGHGEYGWATVDVTTATWSEFTGIPGSAGFDPAGELGSKPVVVDRHVVWLSEKVVGSGTRLGYALDIDTKEARNIEEPVDVLGPDGGGVFADLATDGTIVGWSLSSEGMLDRIAARLDPATGRWTPLPPPPSGPTDPNAFAELESVDVGTVLIGGFEHRGLDGGLRSETAAIALGTGARRWESLPSAPIDLARTDHTMVWTGRELIVWGGVTAPDDGIGPALPLADGASYRVDG